MQKIEIHYNPYKMETVMKVNGTNVCDSKEYSQFQEFIELDTPLQTWAEPIPYKGWKGVLNELVDEDCYENLEFIFHGRELDFEDLKRACESENEKRKNKLGITYTLATTLSDKKLAQNIEVVMNSLLSEKFQKLIEGRGEKSQVAKDYKELEEHYKLAKDKEFKIVVAGLYSSGKSTILNTLIRHTVLPMAGDTCTSKICRIKHDDKMKHRVSIECFDEEGNILVDKEVFEKDEDCYKRFEDLTPLGKTESNPPEIDTIELTMDLSHLYPSPEMAKEFNLVIVDTPGCNSTKTAGMDDGEEENQKESQSDLKKYLDNKDKKIAIDAITEEKEMVIVCADSQDYEDESIGDFLWAIHESNIEDSGDFNDRFLFVTNKCDLLNYSRNESLLGKKEKFARYLMNTNRWEDMDKENSPQFVPRIFMISAFNHWAIQNGADTFTKNQMKEDTEKKDMNQAYKKFRENIVEYEDENYFLLDACDIPEYRKKELWKEYKRLLDEDETQAVAIQTGIGCIESTIRDYIARYAYPFKVRDLLDTFEALLDDVAGVVEKQDKLLQQRVEDLGKGITEREEVEREKSEEENKKKMLDFLRRRVSKKEKKIQEIDFNIQEFHAIADKLEYSVENNAEVKLIRTTDRGLSQEEMQKVFIAIDTIFDEAWVNAEQEFAVLANQYNAVIKEICQELMKIAKFLQKDDKYGLDTFGRSTAIKKIVRLDEKTLRKQVEETRRREEHIESKEIKNPEKEIKYRFWQFIKKRKQKKASDTIVEKVKVVKDVYDMTQVKVHLETLLMEFSNQCDFTGNGYKRQFEEMKVQALQMMKDVVSDIEVTQDNIDEFKKKIEGYGNNLAALNEEIAEIKVQKQWLQSMIEDIRVGGESYV